MILIAKFFKLIFKLPLFRRHYYGFYSKIFKPLNLFRGKTLISRYDKDLRIKLDIGEWIQQQIYFLDFFDERGIRFLKKHLKKDSVFVDIGANIGCYTLIASKIVGAHGRVYAFEPIKSIFDKLKFNLQLNELQNVVAEKKALYEKTDLLKLHLSSDENLGMSSIFRHDTESGSIEFVEAVSLDEYILAKDFNKLDFIKIDIEGSELFALKGMQNAISKYKPIIMIEISEDVLKNTSVKSTDIVNFIKGFNYIQMAISLNGDTIDINEAAENNYFNFVFYPSN
jgi:FkbM family methyltransferase